MEKYTSEVKVIEHSQKAVYSYLSDLNNLKSFIDPDKMESIKHKIPNMPGLKIEDFEAKEDECSFKLDMVGRVGMKIVEKEPLKTIKLTGNETAPLKFFIWIQLLPGEGEQCKMKLTLKADISIMIKVMINKQLRDGVEHVANMIAAIPYSDQT